MDATWAYLEADQAIYARLFPASTARQGDHTMFGTLTRNEAYALAQKLANGGHRFADVGHVLGSAALAVWGTGEYRVLWAQKARYYDGMDELYAIREELIGVAGL